MSGWIGDGWVAQTLIATSLLMATVLLLREPVSHLFGARVAYALWLLPALRMCLPPLPMIGGLFPRVGPHSAPLEGAVVGIAGAAGPTMSGGTLAAMAPPPIAWVVDKAPLLLTGLWLTAAAMWFVVQLLRYRDFLKRAMDGAVMLPREGGIELWVSPTVSGPIAVGIVCRRILLPADFLMRYAPEERAMVLSHEAAHHARHDILANLVALLVRALHWWNPIAHAAYARFRADQELACDATVLLRADAERRATYGRTLIKSAVPRMPALASALDPRIELTKRIRMMTRPPLGRLRLFAGAAIAATMIGGGVMATASAIAQQAAPVPPVPAIRSVPAVRAMPAALTDVPPVPSIALVPPASRGTLHSYVEPTAEERPRIDEARQEAAQARREAEQARIEAQREGAQARAEASRERADAQRDAVQARREALEEASEARREAMAEAQRVTRDIPRMVEVSMAQARARMVAACRKQGVTMTPTSDFGTLATCGDNLNRTIRVALASARNSIAASRELSEEQRVNALRGLDEAMSSLDHAPARR